MKTWLSKRSTHISTLATLSLLAALAACGGSEAAVAARVGWQFDYRDWTAQSSASDLRGCDNVPRTGVVEPAYSPVATVHVVMVDAAGQVPGMDQEVPCERGADTRLMDIRGLSPQVFELTLEAKSAAGVVLYSHRVEEFDLTGTPEERFVLPAASGETHFFPRVDGSLTCPSDAETLRYSAFEVADSVVATDAAVVATQPACDSGSFNEVVMRNIPATPEQGSTGGFLPDVYQLKLELLDSDNDVIYCKTSQRPIKPGNSNLNTDITLDEGACE